MAETARTSQSYAVKVQRNGWAAPAKWNPEFVDVARQDRATRRVLPLAAHDLANNAPSSSN
jgi:hypothetical protein